MCVLNGAVKQAGMNKVYAMHICVSQVVISNKTEVDARRIGWDDMKGIHLAQDRVHIFCEQ
jgi:hypothetical protein